MTIKEIPEPWLSFLLEIDLALDEEVHFHVFGGFAIHMQYELTRPTADVDIVSAVIPGEKFNDLVELAGKGSELHKRFGVYLDPVGVIAPIPIDYTERLTNIAVNVFYRLRIFIMDPYDIALSKIDRNVTKDRQDVSYLAKTVPLDLDILQERFWREVEPDLLNSRIKRACADHLQQWVEMIEEERKACH